MEASIKAGYEYEHPGAWDVFDSWGSKSFELNVVIDSDKANLAGVTNLSIGDRVIVGAPLSLDDSRKDLGIIGCFAEKVVRRTADLSPLPANTSFAQGAAIGVPGLPWVVSSPSSESRIPSPSASSVPSSTPLRSVSLAKASGLPLS